MKNLYQVKDFLLPGVFHRCAEAGANALDDAFDIKVDVTNDRLMIGKDVLFNRSEIEDDSFKSKFSPIMKSVIERAKK